MSSTEQEIPAVISGAIAADGRFEQFRDLFAGLRDDDLRELMLDDLRQIGAELPPSRRALFAVLLNVHVIPFVDYPAHFTDEMRLRARAMSRHMDSLASRHMVDPSDLRVSFVTTTIQTQSPTASSQIAEQQLAAPATAAQ